MDREAFRNRMQQLKQYREQNPGKTYLDWKNSLPSNLQDESNYNLRRAYELGYEPEWNEDDKSYHLPNRSPKLFNKDFQMIPIVNNNDNNTIV